MIYESCGIVTVVYGIAGVQILNRGGAGSYHLRLLSPYNSTTDLILKPFATLYYAE